MNSYSYQSETTPIRKRPRSVDGDEGQTAEPPIFLDVEPSADGGGDMLSPGSSGGPPTRSLFRSAMKYKWSIALITVLLSVPAIVTIWYAVAPRYRAGGQVRVRPIIPHLVFRNEDNGMIPYYKNYLQTQVAIISSPTVLKRALQHPDIRQSGWYRQAGRNLLGEDASKLEALREQLTVRARPRTEVIDVYIETESGNDSAKIVNAVLDEYLQFSRELTDPSTREVYRQLIEQHDEIRHQLRRQQQVVMQLRRELGTTEAQRRLDQEYARLEQMQAEYEDLHRSEAVAAWRLRQNQSTGGPQARRASNDDDVEPFIAADHRWKQLREELAAMDMEIALQGDTLGAAHPDMRRLNHRRRMVRRAMDDRAAQLRDNPTAATMTDALAGEQGVEMQVKALRFEKELIGSDLRKQRIKWENTFDRAQVFAGEMQQLRELQDLYEALHTRLKSKQMERNTPGSIGILAHATVPLAATSDRRGVFSLLAVFGAMLVGLTIAHLRAGVERPTVEGRELHYGRIGPFLGRLPHIAAGLELPLKSKPLLESIRMIRTSLLNRMDHGDGNTVLMTSVGPKEGKTTVSIMLARSLASCGRKVLLIDADVRSPRISASLGLTPKIGLIEALFSGRDDDELILKTDTPGLWVAPSTPAKNYFDSEILANGVFGATLERWKDAYDVVLMDSPPVLLAADAPILARHADGVLLLTRAGHTRRDHLCETLSYLVSAGADLWGTLYIGDHRDREKRAGYPEYEYIESDA